MRCDNVTVLEPKTLHTAGLLHNLGLLWLADHMPDDLTRALAAATADEALSVNDALRRTIGTDIGEVGGNLAQIWELPSTLVSAMQHHDDSEYRGDDWETVAIIGSAVRMSSALQHGRDCTAEAPLLDRLAISPSDHQNVFEKMRDASERTRDLARLLCRL